jgi:uncharacterized protein YndB with AHSA1/START domain
MRNFPLSAERVFDAWLDPVLLGRWMFGPDVRDERVVRLQTEARVGGAFSFVVERQGAEVEHVGEYLEIHRPRRLVFTWGIREHLPQSSRVTVEIAPTDRGCALTLTHEMAPGWEAFAEKAAGAWTKMLAVLDSALCTDAAR